MYNIIRFVTDSFLSYEFLDLQYKGNTDSSISNVKMVFYFITQTSMEEKHGHKAWMRLIVIRNILLSFKPNLCSKCIESHCYRNTGDHSYLWWSLHLPWESLLKMSLAFFSHAVRVGRPPVSFLCCRRSTGPVLCKTGSFDQRSRAFVSFLYLIRQGAFAQWGSKEKFVLIG